MQIIGPGLLLVGCSSYQPTNSVKALETTQSNDATEHHQPDVTLSCSVNRLVRKGMLNPSHQISDIMSKENIAKTIFISLLNNQTNTLMSRYNSYSRRQLRLDWHGQLLRCAYTYTDYSKKCKLMPQQQLPQ